MESDGGEEVAGSPGEPPDAFGQTDVQDHEFLNINERTLFRNLYVPSFNIPDKNEEKKADVDAPSQNPLHEIPLDDPKALKYCDTTRVGWKTRVDYAVNAYQTQRLKAEATENEIQRDPTALLNVTISTVILLASGIYDIPMEYYLYTELYLQSIRDEFNDSPPNIENLIKHIRYIRKANNIQWRYETLEEPPPGLVISKIRNRSRIPLPINSIRQPGSPPKAQSTPERPHEEKNDEKPKQEAQKEE